MFTIVITDSDYSDVSIEEEVLSKVPSRIVFLGTTNPEVISHSVVDADAIITNYAIIGREVLLRANRCKVVSRYGIGLDNVDVRAATGRGILVCNAPTFCIDEVSDHALALLLALSRKVKEMDESVRAGSFEPSRLGPIHRIRGRVCGLIGFGKIARRFTVKAKALGLNVIAFDPYVSSDVFRQFDVLPTTLEDLLPKADYVVLFAPLTPETYHLISLKEIENMRPTAFLINVARGGLVDIDALISGLRNGRLAGAALDVFENEPLSLNDPILDTPGVILTPHAAWYSEEAGEELRRTAASNVVAALQGRVPENAVNPEAWCHVHN